MNKQPRPWQKDTDDDPVAGLVNLFDVWIVVVVALILSLVHSLASQTRHPTDPDSGSEVAASEEIEARASRMPRFRKSQSTATGQGELLGTAYRLQSGEVVYVPPQKP